MWNEAEDHPNWIHEYLKSSHSIWINTQKDWKDHSTISLTEAYSKPHIRSTFIVLLYFCCTLSFYKKTLFMMASLSFRTEIWQAHRWGKCFFIMLFCFWHRPQVLIVPSFFNHCQLSSSKAYIILWLETFKLKKTWWKILINYSSKR